MGRFGVVESVLIASLLVFSVQCKFINDDDVIVTNNPTCTQMAKILMDRYRLIRAVDLYIAINICEGIVHPQDSGLGGGFQAVVYDERCQKSVYINSRERAPLKQRALTNNRASKIGVPSVLSGFNTLYNLHLCSNITKPKRVKWRRMILPNAALAEYGWCVGRRTCDAFKMIKNIGSIIKILPNNRFQNMRLSNTLRIIARDGPSSSLYKRGGLLNRLVLKDLREIGSKLTENDFLRYKVKTSEPNTFKFLDMDAYTTDIPGSGGAIMFACSIVDHYYSNITQLNEMDRELFLIQILRYMYTLQPSLRAKNFHFKKIYYRAAKYVGKIILNRIQKHEWRSGVIKRFGKIKLPIFKTLDHPYGTTNVVVKRGPVTIIGTSTVNWAFGSRFGSKRLGFFYNNQLDDFTYGEKNQHPNSYCPGCQPQSSISTTIFVKNNQSVFGIGAAGGSKILGSIFSAIFHHWVNNETLEASVRKPRCLIKYVPDSGKLKEKIICESGMDRNVVLYLRDNNVDYQEILEAGYGAVTAFSKRSGVSEAVFDPRRGGKGIVVSSPKMKGKDKIKGKGKGKKKIRDRRAIEENYGGDSFYNLVKSKNISFIIPIHMSNDDYYLY